MGATVTVGGSTLQLDLVSEPTYTLGEQGGFKDATIAATYGAELRDSLRMASVNIGNRYLGHVRSAGADIAVQGWQTRLNDVKHGRVYTTRTWERWRESTLAGVSANIDCASTTAGTRVWTWQDGTYYKALAYNGTILWLPESQAVTISFDYSWANMANPRIQLSTSADTTQFYTAQSGTVSFTTSACTYIQILAQSTSAVTPSGDATLTISNMLVTHTAGATLPAVIGDICDLSGALVPLRDIESISHTFDELWFDAGTSLLDMLGTILGHGDWRAYFEPRPDSGTVKPCLVFASRPTVADVTLTEGSGDGWSVSVALDPLSCDPLASIVRCMYTNSYGVELFVDVTDTDPTHYLVANPLDPPKMVVIETGQSTSAAAAAIGTRWLVDGGRDQYSGTVLVEGAPNGIPAADILPGSLVAIDTLDYGTVTSRITEATYTGDFLARLTLDSAPNMSDRIAQWGERLPATASTARGNSRFAAIAKRQAAVRRRR